MRISTTATHSTARSIRSHPAAFASPSPRVLPGRPTVRPMGTAWSAAGAAPVTPTPVVQPLRGLQSAPRRIHTRVAATTAVADMNPQFVDRVRGALWGIFIADALSMPVHWYYDTSALKRDFGNITDYQAPKQRHPGSIMSLSSTGGHGRGDQSGRIIGDVINHGKHEFWGKPAVHYHQGMAAGENTLNAICARVVMRGITDNNGTYSKPKFLEDYVKFMTTPGTHNDTYAESFHRDFFKNWAAGVPPERCAEGTEGHNTAQIGGFVMLPPVIMSAAAAALQSGGSSANAQAAAVAAAREAALTHLGATHESRKLWGYADKYAALISKLAMGQPLWPLLEAEGQGVSKGMLGLRVDLPAIAARGYDDINVVHSVFGSACYIEDSFPSMLYLAWKHADSFENAVLANTNVGGENCHRGAALGALMGAAVGESGIPQRLIQGLAASAEIKKEIDSYCAVLGGSGAAGAAPVAAAASGKTEL